MYHQKKIYIYEWSKSKLGVKIQQIGSELAFLEKLCFFSKVKN